MIFPFLEQCQVYDSYLVCDPIQLPKFFSTLLLFRWLILWCVWFCLGLFFIITLILSFTIRAFCFAFTCIYFYLVGFRIPDFPSLPAISIVSSVLLAIPIPQFGGICGFFEGASVWSPKLIMKILSKTCCRSSSSCTDLKCFLFFILSQCFSSLKANFSSSYACLHWWLWIYGLQVMLNSIRSVTYINYTGCFTKTFTQGRILYWFDVASWL